jgi:hypothetical protein
MITVFKLVRGLVDFDFRQLFSLAETVHGYPTRGNSMKLHKPRLRSRLLVCNNSFAQRTVNIWNRLPEDVVTATSVDAFKARLDNFMQTIMNIYDDAPARLDLTLVHSVERYLRRTNDEEWR